MLLFIVILLIFGLLAVQQFLIQSKIRRLVSANGVPVPGGSWWLPWIGSNLAFLRKSPDQFYSENITRYGTTFLAHILGSPTIVTSTPEQARFVLATRHKSFQACYPPSIRRMLNNPSWEADLHLQIRKVIQTPMLSENLQESMGEFDSLVRWALKSWHKRPYIITHDETRKLAFYIALRISCTLSPSDDTGGKMLDDYGYLSNGSVSLPVNIPGTLFHVALKKSKEIMAALDNIILRRRIERVAYVDILNGLLESKDENGELLSDNQIRDVLLTLLFTAHETTAVLLVWIVKYLTENPEILEQVKIEQLQIRSARRKESLSWSDLKNMPLTTRVIQETLRLSNVVAVSPREVKENVEYKGIFFPKGWKVHVCYRHFHLNEEHYKDPYRFDPSRFEAPIKPSAYMPFGNGIRLCPGSEVVKIEALLFVHYLVTKYSWKIVGPNKGIQYWPTPIPKGGLQLKVMKLTK